MLNNSCLTSIKKKDLKKIIDIVESCFNKEELEYLNINQTDFLVLLRKKIRKEVFLGRKDYLLPLITKNLISVIKSYKFLFNSQLDKKEVRDIFLRKIKSVATFDLLLRFAIINYQNINVKLFPRWYIRGRHQFAPELQHKYFYYSKHDETGTAIINHSPLISKLFPDLHKWIKALFWKTHSAKLINNFQTIGEEVIEKQKWSFNRFIYPEYQNYFQEQIFKEIDLLIEAEKYEQGLPKFISRKSIETEDERILRKWRKICLENSSNEYKIK